MHPVLAVDMVAKPPMAAMQSSALTVLTALRLGLRLPMKKGKVEQMGRAERSHQKQVDQVFLLHHFFKCCFRCFQWLFVQHEM